MLPKRAADFLRQRLPVFVLDAEYNIPQRPVIWAQAGRPNEMVPMSAAPQAPLAGIGMGANRARTPRASFGTVRRHVLSAPVAQTAGQGFRLDLQVAEQAE